MEQQLLSVNNMIKEDKLLSSLGIKTVKDLNEYCRKNPINIAAFVETINN